MNTWNKKRGKKPSLLVGLKAGTFREALPGSDCPESVISDANSLLPRILHHDTIHVNCQAVADQADHLLPMGVDLHEELQDIEPPYPQMWFEFLLGGTRWGCYVEQHPVPADLSEYFPAPEKWSDCSEFGHMLRMWFLCEVCQGHVVRPVFEGRILTSQHGEPEWHEDYLIAPQGTVPEEGWQLLATVVWESLCRMNVHAAELIPCEEIEIPRSRKHRPLEALACVWHESVIRSDNPRQRRVSGIALPTSGAIARREHWVRGHRRDYRKAGKLFGRLSGLFWIPAHKTGDPDLGCVIPEVKIAEYR